jgi:hypothetical protein
VGPSPNESILIRSASGSKAAEIASQKGVIVNSKLAFSSGVSLDSVDFPRVEDTSAV